MLLGVAIVWVTSIVGLEDGASGSFHNAASPSRRARWTALRSSRTLPGQLWAASAVMSSSDRAVGWVGSPDRGAG
jgi:hypothetical protein